MSSVEYDVLVKLHVDRKGGRALGDAAKPLQKGLSLADKQARAAAALRMRELKAADTANRKSLQNQQRGAISEARSRIFAKRQILAEQKKLAAAEKAMRADLGSKASKFTAGGAAIGGAMQNIGMGPLIGWATRAGAIVGGILAGAITTSLATATVSGIGDNQKAEQQQGGLATTLQLYDFNATDSKGAKNDESQQFAANLENAKYYQQELVRIADASPGDEGQIGELFTGMLPGMASVTQDSERILALTQKASLLAAVLDNDFKTVGAQSGRIITGGAGADMETWNRLQKPIRQAGIELGVFNKNQALGTKLTEKFNKLDPETRLKLFEEGVKRLGKPVADYFENSFDGITAQAKSSLKSLRKELGRGGFEAIKQRTNQMNKGGILDKSTDGYKKLFNFAGYLGDRIGEGIAGAMGYAEKAALAVANNWQKLVQGAVTAAEILKEGATTAAQLMAVRTGVGMGMKAGGAAVSGVAGIAQTAASLASLGPAALLAAPAIIGLGIVFGGLSLILGGAVAYVVTNLDTLSATFMEWQATSQPIIDAFWLSIEDLGTKFVALGEYFIGPADSTETFTTIVDGATEMVYWLTDMFSWLLGATANVIDAFGYLVDFVNGASGNTLINGVMASETERLGKVARDQLAKEEASGNGDGARAASLRSNIRELDKMGGNTSTSAHALAESIRGGRKAFDNAGGGTASLRTRIEIREQERLAGALIGPAKPSSKDKPKPPKVNVKVTNHNHFNIRDTDPNAVVAAFNKNQGKSIALPTASALAAARRGT